MLVRNFRKPGRDLRILERLVVHLIAGMTTPPRNPVPAKAAVTIEDQERPGGRRLDEHELGERLHPRLREFNQRGVRLHEVLFLAMHGGDPSVGGRAYDELHFHRLEHDEDIAIPDKGSGRH